MINYKEKKKMKKRTVFFDVCQMTLPECTTTTKLMYLYYYYYYEKLVLFTTTLK